MNNLEVIKSIIDTVEEQISSNKNNDFEFSGMVSYLGEENGKILTHTKHISFNPSKVDDYKYHCQILIDEIVKQPFFKEF